MSVSAETYIVISLMFAVFAAVAAVGTSVVLGAGFERLRAGFDQVKRQSGFFADAIYKLDQRTQKLDEETSKLKSGVYSMGERMERVEKTATFLADGINSLEQRILQGTPAQPSKPQIRMHPVHTVSRQTAAKADAPAWMAKPVREQINVQPQAQAEAIVSGLFRDFPEKAPIHSDISESYTEGGITQEPQSEPSVGLTTLLSRYLTGEQSGSGKGVVYH